MTYRLAGTTVTTLLMAHQVVRAVVAEAARQVARHHLTAARHHLTAARHRLTAARHRPMAAAVHQVVTE